MINMKCPPVHPRHGGMTSGGGGPEPMGDLPFPGGRKAGRLRGCFLDRRLAMLPAKVWKMALDLLAVRRCITAERV